MDRCTPKDIIILNKKKYIVYWFFQSKFNVSFDVTIRIIYQKSVSKRPFITSQYFLCRFKNLKIFWINQNGAQNRIRTIFYIRLSIFRNFVQNPRCSTVKRCQLFQSPKYFLKKVSKGERSIGVAWKRKKSIAKLSDYVTNGKIRPTRVLITFYAIRVRKLITHGSTS